MTNGGGASEKDRSKRLTEQLGFEVSPIISLVPRLCCSKDYYLQFYAITHHFKVLYAYICQQTGAGTWWKGRRATESGRKVKKITLWYRVI